MDDITPGTWNRQVAHRARGEVRVMAITAEVPLRREVWSMRWMPGLSGLVLAGLLIGCSNPTSEGEDYPPVGPPPPAPAPAYRIAGPPFGLLLGATFQLTLLDQKDQAVEATWRVADTLQGSVSDTGLLQGCWGVPGIEVTASPVAAPAIVVRASYAVIYRGYREGYIRSVVRADGGPVDLHQVTGDIDLLAAAGPLPCRQITSVRLELVDPGTNSILRVLGSKIFDPAGEEQVEHQFRWPTTSDPNGFFFVRPVVAIVGFSARVGASVPFQIVN
ncbi:MAG: hypothetical protein AABZ01_14210, partial [Gemmatimonadota bacterium]